MSMTKEQIIAISNAMGKVAKAEANLIEVKKENHYQTLYDTLFPSEKILEENLKQKQEAQAHESDQSDS